jgi:hypothetical protein
MVTPLLRASFDTCVVLSLVRHEQEVWRAIRRLREHGVTFLLTPTVAFELDHFADDYSNTERQWLAGEALSIIGTESMRDVAVAVFTPAQLTQVGQAARRLRHEQLLPPEEWNDTQIICEAALFNCDYLLTGDTHLLGIPQQRLAEVLRQMDLRAPRIISYASILT